MFYFKILAFSEGDSPSLTSHDVKAAETEQIPDWMLEVADNLDVCIAQRDFEEAVNLIEKTRLFWNSISPDLLVIHRELK